MKSAKFGLVLVIFSILLSACGAQKTTNKGETPKKPAPEVIGEIAPNAPPPLEDGGPRVQEAANSTAEQSEERCASARDQVIDENYPVEFKTITLTEKEQKVHFVAQGGQSFFYTKFSNVDFKIDRKTQGEVDILEISNRTTCTQYQSSSAKTQAAAQAMGVELVSGLTEVRNVMILPIGQVHAEEVSPHLSLDPLHPNFLDVTFKKCGQWRDENGVMKCDEATLVEQQTLVINIKRSGRVHRGFELKRE